MIPAPRGEAASRAAPAAPPRTLVVGTAGHIDHGKSALVKALTGTDPDRLKEEQVRGITIDLGFAHAVIGDVTVAFVDVPGHERFVRNMLAGAGGIDAVILVIAADESVMPQTREHFDICRLLGIRRGLVALTKCDLVDDETRELAALEAAELLASSALAGAAIVPVSSVSGAGFDALRQAIAALARAAPRPVRPDVTRLPVDRVFTVRGFGTVVTGTLVSGSLGEGDDVEVLPEGRRVRVRGVQVHGQAVPRAAAPCRVAVNLGAVDAGTLARGVTLGTPGTLAITRRVDLRLEMLPDARPLRHGARLRVHHGTAELPGRVSIAATRTRPDAAWRPAAAGESEIQVPPGAEAYVRVRLERDAVLTRGDLVVFRAYSPAATVAGGRVLDPEPSRAGVRRPSALDRFQRLDDEGLPLALWLEEAAGAGVDVESLVRRGGATHDEVAEALDRLAADEAAFRAADRTFDMTLVRHVRQRLLASVAAHHRAHPLEAGMPRERLRDEAAPGAAPQLFDGVLMMLVGEGTVKGADRIALASHQPTLTSGQAALGAKIEGAAREAGLAALDASGLASRVGAGEDAIGEVVGYLVRERRLVRVDSLLVAAEALDALAADIRARGRAHGPERATVDIADFKARYGLSRKHAIPLLEWLDRERLTRRVGNRREILATGGG